jgi:BlaI family penicillinase repressor
MSDGMKGSSPIGGDPTPRAALSEAELEVLKALWAGGAGTVRQVRDKLCAQGRNWAYTTVLTLLQRLQAKGWAASDATQPAHVYRAAASRDEWLRAQLQSLADQACEGDATPLVLALVNAERLNGNDIARFRALLDHLESEDRDDSIE